jgi:hypothetical protein
MDASISAMRASCLLRDELEAWGSHRGEVTRSIQSPLEAQAGKIAMMDMSSPLHQRGNEIIGDKMDQDFPFDHLGALSTQDIHVEGDLNLMEVEFDIPALGIEFTQFVRWVEKRIGEVSGQGDRGGAVAGDLDFKPYNAKSESKRKSLKTRLIPSLWTLKGRLPNH